MHIQENRKEKSQGRNSPSTHALHNLMITNSNPRFRRPCVAKGNWQGPLSMRNWLTDTLADKIRRSLVQPEPQSSPASRSIQRQGRPAHTVRSVARAVTARNTHQGKILEKRWHGGRNNPRWREEYALAKNLPRICKPPACSPWCNLPEQNDFPARGQRRRCDYLSGTYCHALNVNLLRDYCGQELCRLIYKHQKIYLPTTDVRQVSFSSYNRYRLSHKGYITGPRAPRERWNSGWNPGPWNTQM